MVLPRTFETALDHLAQKGANTYRGKFMGRVAFYRRASDLDELKLSVSQAKEEIVLQLTQQIQTAQYALSGRFDVTDRTLNIHTDKFSALANAIVETKNEIIGATPGRIVPTDVTPKAFIGIRALSQVQDLVTDKDKNRVQNNKTLDRLRKSAPYAEVSELLGDSNLRQRFQAAFQDFASDEFKELAERFVEIQDLNSDLVRYFASKTEQNPTDLKGARP
jgi:single-stranded DNA-specific DHH superfamily exonuclease